MFHRRSLWIRAILLWCQAWLASASFAPSLEQSFFFDWNTPGQPYPIPVTQQCQTIHITWGRGTAVGPNPVSPYYLQVYTSNFLVPFIISVGDVLQYDWAVPFAPGTLYQMCMFDKNGNTGGCQDVYTVIPSNLSTPSCANVTFPSPLQVDASVPNGPLSQYGWVDQCSDISLVPRNGTPPYIMTVAPSLHPPFNITGDGTKPLNWTVSLSWASSFFISVVDSAGNVWSNGLIHSGGGGSTACLSGQPPQDSSGGVSPGIAIGSSLAGLGAGLIAGSLGAILFFHFRNKKRKSTDSLIDLRGSHPGSPQGAYLHVPSVNSHYHAVPTSAGLGGNSLGLSTHISSYGNRMSNLPSGTQYHVEPFVLPAVAEDGRLHSPSSPTHATSNPSLNTSPSAETRPDSSGRAQNQVYVVHHDGGRAPVTVYTQEGTQVVELPPGYPGGAGEVGGPLHNPHSHGGHDARSEIAAGSSGVGSGSSDAGRTEGSAPAATELPGNLQQVRRPGHIQKPSTSRVNRPQSRS